jgi:hypothetical protein
MHARRRFNAVLIFCPLGKWNDNLPDAFSSAKETLPMDERQTLRLFGWVIGSVVFGTLMLGAAALPY